jgi:hypothetical protein
VGATGTVRRLGELATKMRGSVFAHEFPPSEEPHERLGPTSRRG